MGTRSKRKGHVTKRRDGSTYTQDRRATSTHVAVDTEALLAQVRDDVEREKRLRVLQGLA